MSVDFFCGLFCQMRRKLLENDESTTAALCNFSNHDSDGSITLATIIADKLTLCSGCVWWIIDGSVEVLFVFYTSVPVWDFARLLFNDLNVPFYVPCESIFQRGTPSGSHIPIHTLRYFSLSITLKLDLFIQLGSARTIFKTNVLRSRFFRSFACGGSFLQASKPCYLELSAINRRLLVVADSWWRQCEGLVQKRHVRNFLNYFHILWAFRFSALSEITDLTAALPTRGEDVLALFTRNISHVNIQSDPFEKFFKESCVPKVLSIPRKHVDLSSYLGSAFEIGEVIGKGAYGEVFKATRTMNGKVTIMALKVFSRKALESEVRAEFAVLKWLQKLWVFFFQIFRGMLSVISKISGIPKTYDLMIYSNGPKCITNEFIHHDSFEVHFDESVSHRMHKFNAEVRQDSQSWSNSLVHESIAVNFRRHSSVLGLLIVFFLTNLVESVSSTEMSSPRIFCFPFR